MVAGTCAGTQVASPSLAAAAPSLATSVTAGNAYACAIEIGQAYCWGANSSGQLGNGTTTSSSVPVPVYTGGVLAGKTLTQIGAGFNHTCALASSGAVYCWGANSYGQLGNNSTTPSPVPVAVTTSGALSGKIITQIAVGNSHTCALDSSGAAYCWGANGNGDLGNNSTTASVVPVAVSTSGVLAGQTLTQITAGYAHTCAVSSAGAAYCWGANGNGQLGNSSTTQSLVPVAVTASGVLSGKSLTQISADQEGMYTCALDSTGLGYCWGSNNYGQLGNGGAASTPGVPVAVVTSGVLSGRTLSQMATGSATTCAVGSTGAAYCWGQGVNGELGNGATSNSSVPVAVSLSGALSGQALTQVSDGTNFSCAMASTAAVYCWGLGSSGQLGDNSATSSAVAVAVAPQGPTGVTAVAGDSSATVSWTAPVFLNNGSITGYTAAAVPGGASCSTTRATSCTITGLTDGTTYTVTVTVTATTGTAPSAPVTIQPAGVLSISVPASATLPSTAPGTTSAAHLGTVRVTDNRALASASWTATVTATAFASGTGGTPIALANVSYWSGPYTATSGSGTFTPGQVDAAHAQVLATPLTAFSLTGGSGANSASWNPTLVVSVPLSTVSGTYTATITHSVA
ncbi:MAG TPA: fibronectin type III domain-containing protein [Streptosporangiaceae bacterium]|nr:fibronectin type III domain-containing protein [Streptosporangiaceae bacterium]